MQMLNSTTANARATLEEGEFLTVKPTGSILLKLFVSKFTQ